MLICISQDTHVKQKVRTRRGGNLIIRVFQGVGNLIPMHPQFHVKSLAWRAIMGDAVLEDFRGKDCAFVANWLRGKDLKKLCAVFESI